MYGGFFLDLLMFFLDLFALKVIRVLITIPNAGVAGELRQVSPKFLTQPNLFNFVIFLKITAKSNYCRLLRNNFLLIGC